MVDVRLESVSKVYDDAQGTERAVDDLSMTVADGEFAVIVGPSGCGKTTTLRMIAGLETVTEGQIHMGGREVQHLAPAERDVAMVFQNYALYPKMTARKNMAYGLKHSTDMSATERRDRVAKTAEMLDITDVLDDRPDEMSGGQKQRVALGRAIVREPDVFLLDEPLSNLDAKLRAEMRRELQRIHRDLDITTVHVTHDQKEAMTMADRIAVMRDGRLQQLDDPETAYSRPNNRFVGEFLGSPAMNTFEASLVMDDGRSLVRYRGSDLLSFDGEDVDASRVVVGIRPEDVRIGEDGPASFDATTREVEYQGTGNFLFVRTGETELTVRTPTSVRPSPGETVTVSVDPDAVYLFDAATGEAVRS